MARPLSEEKRDAILAAAVVAVAALGVSAPTAKIAAGARLGEGTLFSYFPTKDALLNALYLMLKQDLGAALAAGFQSGTDFTGRWRRVWDCYVDWGAANAAKRNALRQLQVSDRITAAGKAAAAQATQDIAAALFDGFKTGLLRKQPPEFVAGIFEALAEMTLDFVAREPHRLEHYKTVGFQALWRAIAQA